MMDLPFFFLPPSALPAAFLVPRVVVFSLGMLTVGGWFLLMRVDCQWRGQEEVNATARKVVVEL